MNEWLKILSSGKKRVRQSNNKNFYLQQEHFKQIIRQLGTWGDVNIIAKKKEKNMEL